MARIIIKEPDDSYMWRGHAPKPVMEKIAKILNESVGDEPMIFEVVDDDKTPVFCSLEPCPNCGSTLELPPGGGVRCANEKCGYWFCY